VLKQFAETHHRTHRAQQLVSLVDETGSVQQSGKQLQGKMLLTGTAGQQILAGQVGRWQLQA
jgi:hypothetical protein